LGRRRNVSIWKISCFVLINEDREDGLLELDFRQPDNCEIGMFGVTANLIGSGAGRWLMNRALEHARSRASGCTPVRSITRRRWRFIGVRGFGRSGGRSRWRMIRGWTGPRRATWRGMWR
jgi:GNAT superfamily N-acetyltransferase